MPEPNKQVTVVFNVDNKHDRDIRTEIEAAVRAIGGGVISIAIREAPRAGPLTGEMHKILDQDVLVITGGLSGGSSLTASRQLLGAGLRTTRDLIAFGKFRTGVLPGIKQGIVRALEGQLAARCPFVFWPDSPTVTQIMFLYRKVENVPLFVAAYPGRYPNMTIGEFRKKKKEIAASMSTTTFDSLQSRINAYAKEFRRIQ